ncbi:heme peroxidase [Cynara cardunculus var. scolymus]|uniref:Peroxidase n=1 Tax=Cynara cardunculus var. scolymus TaxID=59895 RepID=A0A103XC44_CYNCS|nr:heme peroxidase [Cynara cardunculus var. scolymus]
MRIIHTIYHRYTINCNLFTMKIPTFIITIFIISFIASVFADDYLANEYSSTVLKVPNMADLSAVDDDLSYSLYHESCPDVEGIIYRKVKEWVTKDPTLAPSLLRLQYHDCVVRGCDASILLDHEGSERSSNMSKSLRGFEVIDDIKAEIEKKCPKTVSCADILTTAARDATVLVGGPYWMIPFGRKDGRVSLAKEATIVPKGSESAHTIGRTTCESVQHRLYDYKGTKGPDPSLNPKYLNYLRRKCRWASETVSLDGETPNTFDTQYYHNLKKSMGILSTDQLLYSDSRTKPVANGLSFESSLFKNQFGVSMVKLSSILDLTSQDEGEIRGDCKYVNH